MPCAVGGGIFGQLSHFSRIRGVGVEEHALPRGAAFPFMKLDKQTKTIPIQREVRIDRLRASVEAQTYTSAKAQRAYEGCKTPFLDSHFI